ncbi:unnamed protein product [Phyllotreta striolata]|uniref:Major facilitator superfamily (MFS) profile domain-containing protein n=1 Tax=Phyllotreta striolata TaxID=444603 RepID=A0A9N9TRI7_PHYSR|nr:unnamed protein product [Phyllotreta striolata]
MLIHTIPRSKIFHEEGQEVANIPGTKPPFILQLKNSRAIGSGDSEARPMVGGQVGSHFAKEIAFCDPPTSLPVAKIARVPRLFNFQLSSRFSIEVFTLLEEARRFFTLGCGKMTRKYNLNNMTDYGKSSTVPQYIAALSICLGAVAAGAVLGWTANISDALKTGNLNDIPIDKDSLGWIGSFVNLGAMVMCIPIGYICDLIGRKLSCLLTVVPFLLGWFLIVFADGVPMIYAGRFLTGLAGGAFCVAAPIYTSEIAENRIRGALGSYFQLLLTVGILIAYVAGAFISPKSLAILSLCIPVVFGVVFFFQPETPVYYLKNDKYEAAKASLRRLRGEAYDCEPELKEMRLSLEQNSSGRASFFDVLLTKAGVRACVITFSLMFFQQMSGVNAVIFYTGDIFSAAGSSLKASTATIIVGVLQTVTTFVSSLVVDKFGRKLLLLLSILFMGLSEFVLALYFTFKNRNVLDEETVESIGVLPLLCLGIYIVMFSMGIGPIPWMISAELMAPEIKSVMVSIAATFNWFLAFLVTKFYGNISDAIGADSPFYIFSGICFAGAAFMVMFVPETKGKSVAEIQAMLGGEKPQEVAKEGIDNPSFKY